MVRYPDTSTPRSLTATPWRWAQRWHDLAFLHWPVPAAWLRQHVPSELELDTFEGQAYLGLVPFWMSHVRWRYMPPLPWLSTFPEMNLRTYVTLDDRPGVWFFRMDASRLPAVLAARLGLGLPYVWSQMRVMHRDDTVQYRSTQGQARFVASYAPTGPVREAAHGSLEYFLCERYCLYSVHASRLLRLEIHHPPWPLQPARVDIEENTLPATLGMFEAGPPALVHFSRRQDVVGWGLTFAGGGR